jgi:hypothetical protein
MAWCIASFISMALETYASVSRIRRDQRHTWHQVWFQEGRSSEEDNGSPNETSIYKRLLIHTYEQWRLSSSQKKLVNQYDSGVDIVGVYDTRKQLNLR